MKVKIWAHKPGDGGTLCMPLKANIPEPQNDDWKLVRCPICGAECWESSLAREVLELEPNVVAACTMCALRR